MNVFFRQKLVGSMLRKEDAEKLTDEKVIMKQVE